MAWYRNGEELIPANTAISPGSTFQVPRLILGDELSSTGAYKTSDRARTRETTSAQKMTNALQQRLKQLRNALLALHKALVDSERVSYEKAIGTIESPNDFLQLLTSDPWFAWLHPLSQLIVAMDESLEEKEPLTAEGVEALVRQTRHLLVVSEEGDGYSKHYFDALQRDPDVVLAHAEAAKRLGPRPAQG